MKNGLRIPGLVLASWVGLWSGCRTPEPSRPSVRPTPPGLRERFDLADPETPSLLEPIHVLGRSTRADEEGVDAPAAALELDDVLSSVERHFPLILAAREEIEIAEGKLQEARGGFDTRFVSKGSSELEGFYQSDRLNVSIEQPTTLFGATFSGGYKLGRGDFAVYDGDKKTNEEGEYRIGMVVPLLQSRAIDKRRVALWRARINRERADPIVLQKRLEATLKASDAYWKWVAAGRLREVAVRLLALAENRMQQLELAVEEGLLAPMNLTENERLIVERRAKLVSAERKLQEAAIGLSLYWRDAEGRPAVPVDEALPYEFPAPRPAEQIVMADDESLAVARRPEVAAVELALRGLRFEGELARNSLLPKLDVGLFASHDVGSAVNDPDDKGDLELEAVVSIEVPLQRRKAKGSTRRLRAEVTKLERQAQLLSETVVAEVRDARSALEQSWLRISQARENVRLANELADIERFQLGVGGSDLLRVNLREQQAAVAAAGLVDALEVYFRALAVYRAAMAVPHAPGD